MNTRNLGHVYALHDLDRGLTKVGCSKDPHARVASIVSSVGVINSKEFIGPCTLSMRVNERDVHCDLDAFRKKGEWFACSLEEAKNAILQYTTPATKEQIEEAIKTEKRRSLEFLEMMKEILCKKRSCTEDVIALFGNWFDCGIVMPPKDGSDFFTFSSIFSGPFGEGGGVAFWDETQEAYVDLECYREVSFEFWKPIISPHFRSLLEPSKDPAA